MKKSFILSVLLVAAVGFSSCKKKDDKSSACEIKSFVVDGKEWTVSGTGITGSYPKGTPVHSLAPVIEVSPGAMVKPESGAVQDFSSDKAVPYTVTAEDGKTTKTYSARASVALTN